MSNLLFSDIFKDQFDYNNWDKYISFFEQDEKLLEAEKKSIINSLIYFKENLPKGFLKNAREHRIRKLLTNHTDYSRMELVWIANSLRLFKKNKENYNILKGKIINLKKSKIEGFPFLEIGSLFKNKGYIVSFEQKIQNFNKKPDIIVENPKTLEKIYIEVSTINQSDKINIRRANFSRITNILRANNIRFSGKIFKEIQNDEMEMIESELHKLINKCKTNMSIAYINIKNTIELAISTNNKIDELKKWQEIKNYKMENLISLNLDFSRDAYRITNNKIKKEADQIPHDKIGLIVLKTYPYFIMFSDMEKAILKIKNELNRHPHILGLVIYSNIVAVQDDFEAFYDNDYYSIKSEFDINKKITVFVTNNNFQNTIEKETYKNIYGIFTNK